MSVFTFNNNLCDTPNIIHTVPAWHDTCSQPSYIIQNFYIEEVTILHFGFIIDGQNIYSCFVVSTNRMLILELWDVVCWAWSWSLTLRYFQLIIESNQSISAVKLFIEHTYLILHIFTKQYFATQTHNWTELLTDPTPENEDDGSWCSVRYAARYQYQ